MAAAKKSGKVSPGNGRRDSSRPRENPPSDETFGRLEMMALSQALENQALAARRQETRSAEFHHLRPSGGVADDIQVGKRKRGPMTEEEVRRVVACVASGLSLRQTAHVVARHQSTLVRRIQRDEEFAAQIEWAQTIAQAEPLAHIAKAARKSWRAAAWLVEYLDRKRSGRTEKVDEGQ